MPKERLRSLPSKDKEPVIEKITQLARKYPSRSAAARAWGININTLNSYYKKDIDPPMPREHLLTRIAESEGVSLEWLMHGTPETQKTRNAECSGDSRDGLAEMLSFLTYTEREELAAMLARKGVETILYLLDEDNIQLLRMDRVIKDKVLGKYHPKDDAQIDDNVRQGKECGDAQITANTPASLATDKKKAV